MTTLDTERPAHCHLVARKFAEKSRLGEQQRRLAAIDPAAAPRAHAAMAQVVRETAGRLDEIEAELKGEAIEAQRDVEHDDAIGRQQMRARLHHLLLVLDRHAPPSCEGPAHRLKAAINRELRARYRACEREMSCD